MHTNPETLALLALGEPVGTPEERAHVAECPICSHEVDDLAHLATVGRTTDDTDTLSSPGPEVWDRICAELGFVTSSTAHRAVEGPEVIDAGSRPPRATSARAVEPAVARPRRRLLSLALAAALALIAGVGIGVGISQLGDDEVIATAELVPGGPQWAGARGEAEVQVDDEGRHWLVLTDVATPRPTAEQQVWLISGTQPDQMKNLGLFHGNGSRYQVDGIDLEQFPLVDISDEPDANPAHSGNTIVRGPLSL